MQKDGLEIYETSDFNLAAYLCSEGLLYRGISCKDKKTRRCLFTLAIPKKVNFSKLLSDWNTDETEKIKKFAHQWKVLRSEIKSYFENLR